MLFRSAALAKHFKKFGVQTPFEASCLLVESVVAGMLVGLELTDCRPGPPLDTDRPEFRRVFPQVTSGTCLALDSPYGKFLVAARLDSNQP